MVDSRCDNTKWFTTNHITKPFTDSARVRTYLLLKGVPSGFCVLQPHLCVMLALLKKAGRMSRALQLLLHCSDAVLSLRSAKEETDTT